MDALMETIGGEGNQIRIPARKLGKKENISEGVAQ